MSRARIIIAGSINAISSKREEYSSRTHDAVSRSVTDVTISQPVRSWILADLICRIFLSRRLRFHATPSRGNVHPPINAWARFTINALSRAREDYGNDAMRRARAMLRIAVNALDLPRYVLSPRSSRRLRPLSATACNAILDTRLICLDVKILSVFFSILDASVINNCARTTRQ